MRARELLLLLVSLPVTAFALPATASTTRFVITAPDNGILGQSFVFSVTAADDSGNPTAGYTGAVEFQSHGVAVPAGYVFTPADGGTKSFTGTPTRGGHVLFGVHDAAAPGVSGSTSMEIACPGFTVSASNDGPVCPNEMPALTATTSETGVTFDWQGPRFWTASGPVVEGVPNYQGTYSVTMSSPNGCTAFAETAVTLTSTNPDVQGISDPHWFCDGVEKTYAIVDSATNGPYTGIVWSIDGNGTIVAGQGTTSVTILPDHDENGPLYQRIHLYLSATNGAGCVIETRLAEADIDVNRLPAVTIDTPSSACSETTLVARPVRAPATSSSLTFHWSIENGTITETNHPSGEIRYTVDGGNDAVLTLVVNDAYCSYTTTATVGAGASATIASASYGVCPGEPVQIPVTLGGAGPFTVHWSDGHVQTVDGSFTRTVAPETSTSYSIVSVSNANCSSGGTAGSVEVTMRNDARITQQPVNAAVPRGSRATLTVAVTPEPTAVQWYRGARGDYSNPVSGATSLQFTTPPITENTMFWAEVETSCGTVGSNAATVTVTSKRRAVRK